MQSANFKRPLLYCLIVSVTLGAFLGIVLVLRSQWGWIETRIMLTTFVVAVASVCGLACDLSRIPKGLNLLPKLGLASTLVSAALILAVVWTGLPHEFLVKLTFCASIFATATVHACLLSIARLTGGQRWVSLIATQLIYGLAALLIFMVVSEVFDETLWRYTAVLSIVIAALTLVIPILYRLGRNDRTQVETLMPNDQRSLAKIDEELATLRTRIKTLETLREQVISTGS